MDEKVTVSDCCRAIDSIEAELTKLSAERREVERKIEALSTQRALILKIVKML